MELEASDYKFLIAHCIRANILYKFHYSIVNYLFYQEVSLSLLCI